MLCWLGLHHLPCVVGPIRRPPFVVPHDLPHINFGDPNLEHVPIHAWVIILFNEHDLNGYVDWENLEWIQ